MRKTQSLFRHVYSFTCTMSHRKYMYDKKHTSQTLDENQGLFWEKAVCVELRLGLKTSQVKLNIVYI